MRTKDQARHTRRDWGKWLSYDFGPIAPLAGEDDRVNEDLDRRMSALTNQLTRPVEPVPVPEHLWPRAQKLAQRFRGPAAAELARRSLRCVSMTVESHLAYHQRWEECLRWLIDTVGDDELDWLVARAEFVARYHLGGSPVAEQLVEAAKARAAR